jgi:hypothetical protein
LLPAFAVTYPVDYFSLVDCATHCAMTHADEVAANEIAAAIHLLHAGISECLQSPALLQQPTAVLSLASAVTSNIKACKLQCAELVAGSEGPHGTRSACVPAARQLAVLSRVLPVVGMLHCLSGVLAALLPQAAASRSAANGSDGSRSASSSGSGGATVAQGTSNDRTEQQQPSHPPPPPPQQQQQQTATKVLLAVLLARSVTALADAADSSAGLRAVLQDDATSSATAFQQATGSSSSSSSRTGMQQADGAGTGNELTSAFLDWQYYVIEIVDTVHSTLSLLGLGTAAQPCSSGCSGNSSSSSGQVRWAYLLQLKRSKKLVTAFDMLSAASRFKELWSSIDAIESYPAQADYAGCEGATAGAQSRQQADDNEQAMDEVYSASLQFCQVLAGAAPLPHLCNNLGCSSVAAGGTEAAAAVKVCSGCGAWYCSAGCAAAHWRQHKKACRRMAALRLDVNK